MKHVVPGQDDDTLAVGAGGDKTVIIATYTTHVRVKNLSSDQVVMYSEINVPAYPNDWRRLDPEEKLMVRMNGGGVNLFLRQTTGFRLPLTNRTRADMLDTPVTVEVEGIDVT